MNQESQATDSTGRRTRSSATCPAASASAPPTTSPTRTANGRAFHVCARTPPAPGRRPRSRSPSTPVRRTQLVLDKYDNAYAVLPFGRIAGACRSCGYTDWTVLFDGAGLNAFGEVVVDESGSPEDNVLSVLYQEKSSGTTPSALRVVDFRLG